MPRIAAALAVLVAVTFSIGFNISRYPAVWMMLGPAPPPASQGSQPIVDLEASAVAAQHELPVSQSAPPDLFPASSVPLANRMPEPIAVCETDVSPPQDSQGAPEGFEGQEGKTPDGYRVECDGESCRLVAEQPSGELSQTAPVAAVAEDSGEAPVESTIPAAAKPAAKYASAAPVDLATTIRSEKPLVPLAKPQAAEPPPAMPGTGEVPDAAPSEPKVRHLPPIDQEWGAPAAGGVPSPDGPIPLYATTPFP